MQLMRQIATNAADYAVGKYGQHLSKGKQLALWQRHYDSVIASLMTFDDLQRARRIRAQAIASEN